MPLLFKKGEKMQRKTINSQLSNFKTYEMYKRQFLTLAENVFEFENLPNFIDTAYMNKQLLRNGSIAFFKDEVMGLLALPYRNVNTLDVYGRPKEIEVIASNGYNKNLKQDEFVIMYDNNGRYPLWLDIIQYSERMTQATRVIDINLAQMKTPRFWKTTSNKEKSVRDMVNNVDAYNETVITYDDIDLQETNIILNPAPYIAGDVNLEKDKIYNEFLRLIGIANLSYQKKERNISDEIQAMQGGTVASRYSRFEPRKKAVEEINKKWGTDIKVKYYDGLPKSTDDFEEYSEESEVEEI